VSDFAGVKLHVVTGKGGTGKTTVAASLALALAAGGRRTLLTEVEGRQGIAQLFDSPPLPYAETKIAIAPGGGDVDALAIDPEAALLEYLELFYNLKRAGYALRKLGAVDFATTIAPGLRDVLLTGKVKESVTRSRRGGPRYDAVVLDAPPTGRIARFLNVNAEVAGLARVGPVRKQADSVMALLRSQATAVHFVSVLEEMPVQEVLDGVAGLSAAKLPVGGIVVNMVRPPLLPVDDLGPAAGGGVDREQVATGLKAAGIEAGDARVDTLLAQARQHAVRLDLEEHERDELARIGRPTYELPMLDDAIDLGGLYELAGALVDQGMT
jgi:anion-transporting  ArsA/GET3 family ATPase